MATICTDTIFSANEADFPGVPLVLDSWLPLGAVDLNLVTVTLHAFDIPVLGGEGGGILGGEGGGILGPE